MGDLCDDCPKGQNPVRVDPPMLARALSNSLDRPEGHKVCTTHARDYPLATWLPAPWDPPGTSTTWGRTVHGRGCLGCRGGCPSGSPEKARVFLPMIVRCLCGYVWEATLDDDPWVVCPVCSSCFDARLHPAPRHPAEVDR